MSDEKLTEEEDQNDKVCPDKVCSDEGPQPHVITEDDYRKEIVRLKFAMNYTQTLLFQAKLEVTEKEKLILELYQKLNIV